MASRTRVRAFKCAGCDYLTQNEDDLAFRAKVTVIPEAGVTLKAHKPECLIRAVEVEVMGSPGEEERNFDEQYETEDGQPTASVAL